MRYPNPGPTPIDNRPLKISDDGCYGSAVAPHERMPALAGFTVLLAGASPAKARRQTFTPGLVSLQSPSKRSSVLSVRGRGGTHSHKRTIRQHGVHARHVGAY
jgi:hypothetical protein